MEFTALTLSREITMDDSTDSTLSRKEKLISEIT